MIINNDLTFLSLHQIVFYYFCINYKMYIVIKMLYYAQYFLRTQLSNSIVQEVNMVYCKQKSPAALIVWFQLLYEKSQNKRIYI